MSYDITIGQKIWVEAEEDGEQGYFSVGKLESDNAPILPGDKMTGKSNERSPAYTSWNSFTEEVGLHDLFWNTQDGLMGRGEGDCTPLTNRHGRAIHTALKAYQARYPGLEPGFCTCNPFSRIRDCACNATDESANLARLIWLDYWVILALENCTEPVLCWSM